MPNYYLCLLICTYPLTYPSTFLSSYSLPTYLSIPTYLYVHTHLLIPQPSYLRTRYLPTYQYLLTYMYIPTYLSLNPPTFVLSTYLPFHSKVFARLVPVHQSNTWRSLLFFRENQCYFLGRKCRPEAAKCGASNVAIATRTRNMMNFHLMTNPNLRRTKIKPRRQSMESKIRK